MLEIKNTEIEFIITVDDKQINSADYPYYEIYLKLSITFISGGVKYTSIWGCYNGEIKKFRAELTDLKDNNRNNTVVFSPMNESSTLTIEKITTPYETYILTLKLFSSLNSETFIYSKSILDQSYLSGIIEGVSDLLK